MGWAAVIPTQVETTGNFNITQVQKELITTHRLNLHIRMGIGNVINWKNGREEEVNLNCGWVTHFLFKYVHLDHFNQNNYSSNHSVSR